MNRRAFLKTILALPAVTMLPAFATKPKVVKYGIAMTREQFNYFDCNVAVSDGTRTLDLPPRFRGDLVEFKFIAPAGGHYSIVRGSNTYRHLLYRGLRASYQAETF